MRRSSSIGTVFRKELRELLRDRRSLLVMFGVPLVVYPVLFAGIGALAKGKAEEQRVRVARVVVEGGENAPELMRRLGLEENHLEVVKGKADRSALGVKDVDAALRIPVDAERELMAPPPAPPAPPATQAAAPVTPASDEEEGAGGVVAAGPRFEIVMDRSRTESDVTAGRVRGILRGYERWVLDQRLAKRGVGREILAPIDTKTIDIATQDQRLGRFLAQLLPLLLMVTGMLGAFFPALSATTTERELGTLETLLVSPVSRTELLVAKGILVLCCSILTAGLNMVSMSAVFANIAAQAGDLFGQVSVNPTSLVLAFLATIPSLVLFSAAVMCVGMIARTYREANSFAAPVMMLPMAAMAIGMADPPTTKALLATPVANTTIIIRDILTARFTWGNLGLVAASNLLFAGVVLSVAARLFTNEQLVNPAWEPLSLSGFKRGAMRKRLRWPTVDEALVLIALGILLQFYAGPWLSKLFTKGEINAPVLIITLLVGSFLIPSVLLGVIGRYNFRRVFSLRSPPFAGVVAAGLLGMGLVPLAMGWGQLQSYLLPAEPSDAARSVAKLIEASLDVSTAAAVLLFGVVPGICEEVLFRGVVLSALRKRLNIHAAVWITGVLFALVHMDFAGLVPRTVLGAMLGYVVVWTGSIFPAMLLHAMFNGSQVGLLAYYSGGSLATTQSAEIPEGLRALSVTSLLRLLGGLVMIGLAAVLLRILPRRDIVAEGRL